MRPNLNHLNRVKHQIATHKYQSQIGKSIAKIFGFESETYFLLMSVIMIVSETHDRGRRDNGEFLKSHEFAMFVIALLYCGIRDIPTLIAILLHDMHEDYPEIWSLYIITEKYGEEVATIVSAVTKPDKALFETMERYDEAIFAKVKAGGQKAMVVKCIDRLHNMLTLHGDIDKRRRKVCQTMKYMFAIAVQCNTLPLELLLATTEQAKRLNKISLCS